MAGRPREFDIDRAAADACDALWAEGIHATSISDLCAATGLSTGSIYKAFDSKDGLVHAALDHYLNHQLAEFNQMAADGDPLTAIRKMLGFIAAQASSTSAQRGCFTVTATLELGGSDPKATDRIIRHAEATHRLLADLISAADEQGLVPSLVDDRMPEELSANIWLTINGLQLRARAGITVEEATHLLDTTMQLALGVHLAD